MKTNAKRPARGKGTGRPGKKRRTRGQGPFAYTVPVAGAMIGLSRSASYRAVHLKQIPAVEINGGWIVPKLRWDAMLGIGPAQQSDPQASEKNAEFA